MRIAMGFPTYDNFDLLIDRTTSGSYKVRVIDAPAGQAQESAMLVDLLPPPDPVAAQDPQTVGAQLFERVFTGKVGEALHRSIDLARKQNKGLRIRLHLADVPELAFLPWEFLFDSTYKRFLALSEQTSLVRYVELQHPDQPLAVELPLRLLGLISDPPDVYPRLGSEQLSPTAPSSALISRTEVRTDGGTFIGGNATVLNGDMVGRDKIIIGYTPEQVSALLAKGDRDDQSATWDGRTPYMGLVAFQEADAKFFFGREKLVNELLERVQSARFVCVAGPSGSGKSSLVQAGLIPALRQGKVAGSDKWLFATFTPGGSPIAGMAQALARLTNTPDAKKYLIQHGETDANALFDQAEALLNSDPRQRLVVYVNQFEELFTQTKNEEQKCSFLNLLTTSVQRPEGRVIVILALRSDFVTQCADYPELRELINQQFQLVGKMEPKELTKAILQPARAVGADVEPRLIEQLIADMQGEPGALPLLQFALKDLFDAQVRRKGEIMKLTLTDYLQRGGLRQALEHHAESVFNKFTEQQQQLACHVFTKVIEVGRGSPDTGRTVRFAELVTSENAANQVDSIVQILAQARLLTVDDQDRAYNHEGIPSHSLSLANHTVTLAHERLIDAWPWLRRLIDENRDSILISAEWAK